jgi:magnesium transporter
MTDAPHDDPAARRSGPEPEQAVIAALLQGLDAGDRGLVDAALEELHAADLADLIEQLGTDQRRALLAVIPPDTLPEVLTELSESARDQTLALLSPETLAEAVRELDTDDVVYLVEDLDAEDQARVLQGLDPEDRAVVEQSLTYPEYSAGRLMQREVVTAPPFWTVGQLIDWLRAAEELPERFYDVVIVDPAMKPLGKVTLGRVLSARRPVTLESIMDDDPRVVRVDDPQEDVALAFNKYHLVSAPVVDAGGRLVGVITIDDAMEALSEEAEEDILRLAGVGDEELSDGVLDILRRRVPWLTTSAVTASVAASVISLFEDTIEAFVALATLLPIVAAMGGNAGTQSLTVAVRALATRTLTRYNAWRVVRRELMVGVCNGLIFGALIGTLGAVFFGNAMLGPIIAGALIANMFAAALLGILVPMTLDRLGADPAVSSGTFVTTSCDVVGFFAFLFLATAVLL